MKLYNVHVDSESTDEIFDIQVSADNARLAKIYAEDDLIDEGYANFRILSVRQIETEIDEDDY